MKTILLSVAIILVVSAGVFFLFFKPQMNLKSPQKLPQTQRASDFVLVNDCESPVEFSHHITDVSAIVSILPPVFRNNAGPMQTTLININGSVPLYMPTGGKIFQGAYYNEQNTAHYLFDIDLGCGITITFDHITQPVEKIKKLFPEIPKSDTRTDIFVNPLEMTTGELIGYTTGTENARNWNFAVYDNSQKNYLWQNERFKDLPKLYTQVCPFKYYDASMAEIYEALFVTSFGVATVEDNLCNNSL